MYFSIICNPVIYLLLKYCMISMTERAADKVIKNISKRGMGIGIKIGVKTTGCSGLAYVLEYVDLAPSELDHFQYQSNGADIWVSKKDTVYIKGLNIDYVRNGLNEGFEFQNPNERDRCGCGESFRV
jgi:iron-sulfur cluster assembly protein